MKNISRHPHHDELKGEVVEAYGGHIMRSTGRKDRHSKVVTSKGVRDRRVRLSAQTAIQFYDVQDRLGYERPSMAVDWLMQHAKDAIDQLAQAPRLAIHPNYSIQRNLDIVASNNKSNDKLSTATGFECSVDPGVSSSSSHAEIYQNYRSGLVSQDLRLSLQSLQEEPSSVHGQQQVALESGQQAFFSAEAMSAAPWTVAQSGDSGDGGAEFAYNVALTPQAVQVEHKIGYAQREPLQSSYLPSFRGWVDSVSTYHALIPIAGNLVIADNYAGFTGFTVPTRFRGEEEGSTQQSTEHH